MLAVNYTNFRENMKTYMDRVTDDYETVIVTRKDNRNVVMISEESYNNLIEDISRNGNEGIGKPEPLTGNLEGLSLRGQIE